MAPRQRGRWGCPRRWSPRNVRLPPPHPHLASPSEEGEVKSTAKQSGISCYPPRFSGFLRKYGTAAQIPLPLTPSPGGEGGAVLAGTVGRKPGKPVGIRFVRQQSPAFESRRGPRRRSQRGVFRNVPRPELAAQRIEGGGKSWRSSGYRCASIPGSSSGCPRAQTVFLRDLLCDGKLREDDLDMGDSPRFRHRSGAPDGEVPERSGGDPGGVCPPARHLPAPDRT